MSGIFLGVLLLGALTSICFFSLFSRKRKGGVGKPWLTLDTAHALMCRYQFENYFLTRMTCGGRRLDGVTLQNGYITIDYAREESSIGLFEELVLQSTSYEGRITIRFRCGLFFKIECQKNLPGEAKFYAQKIREGVLEAVRPQAPAVTELCR